MDRLISLEPSNEVVVRVEPGSKCSGELTLRNVMYTMPVAFRLQPLNRGRYIVRPQSGVISPLAAVIIQITYIPPTSSNMLLPESVPNSGDPFLLHSVVVPGAATVSGEVPNDWFTSKKKQVFIDSGVRVFFVGSAVLARLVKHGTMEEVRSVLEKSKAEWHAADAVDVQGHSLLHLAIAAGRPDLVQLILEFDPDVEVTSCGQTPLEAAAAAGDALVAELLLARKAPTERSTKSAWGALHHAAARGHAEVVKLLMMKGAAVDATTSDGRTALHLAAAERRLECSRLLLAGGSLSATRGGLDGGTPLHAAAEAGDEKMVRLLLSRGSAGLKDVRNYAGRTAYEVAAESGHGRLFDLLKLGDGLCISARKGEARAVLRLIDRGASANGRDQHGWTAMMRAAFKGKVEVVRALIERGAEIDARDEDGHTALHCSVEAGQTEVVEVIVKRGGADLEARTSKGKTAMQIAGILGYTGIARILVQSGAVTDGAPPLEGRVPGEKVVVGKFRVLESELKKNAAAKIVVGKFKPVDMELKKKMNRLDSRGGAGRVVRGGRLERPAPAVW